METPSVRATPSLPQLGLGRLNREQDRKGKGRNFDQALAKHKNKGEDKDNNNDSVDSDDTQQSRSQHALARMFQKPAPKIRQLEADGEHHVDLFA